METIGTPGPSTSDADPDIESILEEVDIYIQALAWKGIPYSSSSFTHVDFDVDDLAQRSRIKLWQALQKKNIENPRAYLRTIVRNEIVNLVRQFRDHLPLRTDIDGELSADFMLETSNEELDSPEYIIEQKEVVADLLSDLAKAISKLHKRQQQVTFCTVKDRVDDLHQFVEVCKEYGLNTGLEWPAEDDERHLLQASFGAAKRNIAQFMNVDLDLYKRRR